MPSHSKTAGCSYCWRRPEKESHPSHQDSRLASAHLHCSLGPHLWFHLVETRQSSICQTILLDKQRSHWCKAELSHCRQWWYGSHCHCRWFHHVNTCQCYSSCHRCHRWPPPFPSQFLPCCPLFHYLPWATGLGELTCPHVGQFLWCLDVTCLLDVWQCFWTVSCLASSHSAANWHMEHLHLRWGWIVSHLWTHLPCGTHSGYC